MRSFFLLFLISLGVQAQTLCPPDVLPTLPIQSGGRVKPLEVFAGETFRFISGTAKPFDEAASVSLCRLSFQGMGVNANLDPLIKVEHVEAKRLAGMSEGDSTIVYSKLQPRFEDLRAAWVKQKENNAFKKELSKVLSRLQTTESILSGNAWTLPEENGENLMWVPFSSFVNEEKVKSAGAQNPEAFTALFKSAHDTYVAKHGDHFMLEYKYQRLQPFLWSLLLAVIALGVVFAVQNPLPGTILAALVIGFELTGMIMRIFISGRAPVTNMYETVMFSGLGALVIGFILSLVKKEKLFLIGGLAYNCLCLMMMKFANNMLDPAISPLVPVLRDNFWLSTHVTTIILSYAALALSWILANVILLKQTFGHMDSTQLRVRMEQTYTCIKVGATMLALGIILGGIWADYSWGRFWGWDPKETWSLIVLLVYMSILHGRYTNWIPPKRFVLFTAAAFMSVMMAWFGVNYILATGLHSYGFSEGGAIFLGTFFLIQTSLLVISQLKLRKKAA